MRRVFESFLESNLIGLTGSLTAFVISEHCFDTFSVFLNAIEAAGMDLWLGARGEAVSAGKGGTITNARWIGAFVTVSPSSTPAMYTLQQGDDTAVPSPSALNICGSTDRTSFSRLFFENCDNRRFRYVCEYC